jgi:hypothetical protein
VRAAAREPQPGAFGVSHRGGKRQPESVPAVRGADEDRLRVADDTLWVPNIRPGTLTCDFVDAAVIV